MSNFCNPNSGHEKGSVENEVGYHRLAGLPKINSTLMLGIHEPLRQRIVMNYNLEGLSKEEGKIYIHEKLKGAGCNQTIFEEAAIEAILNAADGYTTYD